MSDRFISSRCKVWRTETTSDRKFASAVWRECRKRNIPVRGNTDGDTCRLQMHCTEWTVFKVLNAVRADFAAQQPVKEPFIATITPEQFKATRRQCEKALARNVQQQGVIFKKMEDLRALIRDEFTHSVRHALACQLSELEQQLAQLQRDGDVVRRVAWTQAPTSLQPDFLKRAQELAALWMETLPAVVSPVPVQS